jgi:hypothetical protein
MKTRNGFVSFLFVMGCIVPGLSQTYRSSVTAGVLYDQVIDQALPSYLSVRGGVYKLHTERVKTKTNPTLGFTVGYQVNRSISKRIELYSGLSFSLRKLEYEYTDRSLLAQNPRPPRWDRRSLHIEVKKTFSSVTLPIGALIHLNKHFFVDFGGRVNMTLGDSDKKTCDKDLRYKLNILQTQSPNKIGVDVSGGAGYTVGRSTISIKYLYGVTPLFPVVDNAYDQLIPSKLNFSSLMLSYNINIDGYFFRKRKVD